MVHDKEHSTKEGTNNRSIGGWIVRLILTAVVLGITSFFTPGFSITGIWSYLIAAVVISVIDYLVEAFMGVDASPFGRGLKGFFIAAIVLYVAQFFVPTIAVSIFGAMLAALVIGILDAVLPGKVM